MLLDDVSVCLIYILCLVCLMFEFALQYRKVSLLGLSPWQGLGLGHLNKLYGITLLKLLSYIVPTL